jgi:FkbM family methyltransferase
VCGYDLWVSDVMADWDAIAGDSDWERERIASIMETLGPGDVLFDIGVEHAWMSAIFASRVGGHNMVLVEPSAAFWPTIRRTWEHNELAHPRACWQGYAGRRNDHGVHIRKSWPGSSVGEETHDPYPYKHPKHHKDIPTITIDRITAQTSMPVGITIDVEGAELEVLEGARATMASARPQIWLSLHPNMLLESFGAHVNEVFKLLLAYDYQVEILRVDHETHVYARPR